jgi:hypothetical protein
MILGVVSKRDRETLAQAAGDKEDVLSNCTNERKDSNERRARHLRSTTNAHVLRRRNPVY